jgi:hypothetical protein
MDFINAFNELILFFVLSVEQAEAFHYLAESERLFNLALLLKIG